MLQLVEASFHRVASAVRVTVEGGWSATSTTAVSSVSLLVDLLGDGVTDPAFAQVGTEPAGAVGLVCDHMVGAAARASDAEAPDVNSFQQRLRADSVMALAGSDQQGQGPAPAVACEVEFRRQTTA